jgi:hypothetical protein
MGRIPGLHTYYADTEQNCQVRKETEKEERFRCRANHHGVKYIGEQARQELQSEKTANLMS